MSFLGTKTKCFMDDRPKSALLVPNLELSRRSEAKVNDKVSNEPHSSKSENITTVPQKSSNKLQRSMSFLRTKIKSPVENRPKSAIVPRFELTRESEANEIKVTNDLLSSKDENSAIVLQKTLNKLQRPMSFFRSKGKPSMDDRPKSAIFVSNWDSTQLEANEISKSTIDEPSTSSENSTDVPRKDLTMRSMSFLRTKTKSPRKERPKSAVDVVSQNRLLSSNQNWQ